MSSFETIRLSESRTELAPDGSEVRVLLSVSGGSMAHFTLGPGKVSRAITHATVEEMWYVTAGRGEMWRKRDEREEVVALEPGVCLTIPRRTHFQFRASPTEGVAAIGVTLPPWPGHAEASAVQGRWVPSVA